ncbi:MAG: hypothetical protein COA90_05810 [Gammaproteobacteria bacterium]|nr:MAG: hypothetical protein COA90_05810 [Gammaproteobacteria bacterium]
MNKAYKVIWNVSRQTWMIVGELSKSKGKSKSSTASIGKLTRNLSAALLAAGMSAIPIQVLAANIFWDAGTADWFTPTNWRTNSLPTASDDAYINNAGTAEVSSGSANVSRSLVIGYDNAGSLTISNGGAVMSNSDGYISYSSGSTGTVTVEGTGSSWTMSRTLGVGSGGDGSLTISNGGTVTTGTNGFIGYSSGSTGTVTVEGAGSSWTMGGTDPGTLNVGTHGTGSLTISNGGAVTVSAAAGSGTGSADIAVNSDATGTLNIGAASGDTTVAAGTLNADRVNFGSGNGSLVFNHTDTAYDFAVDIVGGGAVTLLAGSTHFSGDLSTYRGTLTVDGGTLAIHSGDTLLLGTNTHYTQTANGVLSIGDGSLTISNGGTVTAGSGTGNVDLAAGSGRTGTLNIGAASGDTAVAAGTLNAARVHLGPGNSSLVFNHTDAAYDFAADIAGGGAVTLLAGSTHFSGDLSTYNGGTFTIDGGTLAIHSGDTLSLGTDYTQAANGVLSIGVADDTTFGKLVVDGTATLASNAKINIDVANTNFSFSATDMADIISASTLVSDGTFAVTDNSVLFDFIAVKDGNTVDLTLTAAGAVTAVGSTGSSAATGAANVVDKLSGAVAANGSTGNTKMDAVITKLGQFTTEKALTDAIETMLPSMSGGTAQMTSNAANAVKGIVSSRQNTLQGLSSGDAFLTNHHIWLKPFGGRTEQDTRQRVTGYDVNSYGLAVGIDGDISSSWNVGGALAYINSDAKSKLAAGSNRVDMDSYIAKVYASKTLDDITVLNLQAGAGIANYDSHRRIFTGDVANADYHSWNGQLSAELGRSYSLSDNTIIAPYIHADYSYVNVGSYSESGAGALNLKVDDDSADSLVIGVGAKAVQTVSDSLSIMVNAGVGYDVMTDRSSLTSSFAGGGAQFTTEGIEPDEVVYNAGVGAKYSLTNGTEISANYTIDARQDYTDQSLSVNLRMLF